MNSTQTKNERKNKRINKEEMEMLAKENLIKKNEQKGIYICPREINGKVCGKEIDYIRKDVKNGHVYFYAVHYLGTDGKGHAKLEQHYLGALKYDYVERLNKMGLHGLVDEGGSVDVKRDSKYLEELMKRMVSEKEMTMNDIEKMLDAIENAMKFVVIDEEDIAKMREKMQKIMEKVAEKEKGLKEEQE